MKIAKEESCFFAQTTTNDDRHKCSDASNDSEKCFEENKSMNTKDTSTLMTAIGKEIDGTVKECELLRRDLEDHETKLKDAELWISYESTMIRRSSFILDLLHIKML